MYDNGRRANRHYCKQLHKSRQKKEYANTFYSGYSWKWIVDHTSFYYCHKNGINIGSASILVVENRLQSVHQLDDFE